MAFAFLVEDGTGLTLATSYVSDTDADDILETNIHATEWLGYDVPTKQLLLGWASRFLDDWANWSGSKFVETSGLRWPRCGAVDRDGFLIDSDIVPKEVEEATAEMARVMGLTDKSLEESTDSLKRIKADVVEIEFDERIKAIRIPSNVKNILKGLAGFSSGRNSFGRIVKS